MLRAPSTSWLPRFQGCYFIACLWPLVAPKSFQAVTGDKADIWLARAVGSLLAVSRVVLLKLAKANRVTPEIMLLPAGQATALAMADLYCVVLPGTTTVYWVDAVVEVALVISWMRVGRKKTPDHV